MKPSKMIVAAVFLLFLSAIFIAGCGTDRAADDSQGNDTAAETGTLVFTANGEDFIREGFVTKDGWLLEFDHVYVTVSGVTAYQTDPPYDTAQGWDIDYTAKVELPGVHTVDLAGADADPAFVGEVAGAPAGRYNALSWDLVQAAAGPADSSVIFLSGRAVKDEAEIAFTIRLGTAAAYLGGDYIGDTRKGILAHEGSTELEMTFHFDHLFGDAGEDQSDPLNREALGFDPLAALAVDGVLDISPGELQDSLSDADYNRFVSIMTHLAHVGEGHCLAELIINEQ